MTRKISFDFGPRTEPFRHQLEAIDYVRTHENIALFDEQGLGKSKIVIDALCQSLSQKSIEGVLIVCKKTLLHTWRQEIEKHSNLFPIVLEGTKRQRGRTLITYGHFYIVNYECLIQEMEIVSLLLRHKRFAIVLDESQRIKNPKSRTAGAVLSLRNLAAKRIIITGTPIANRPEDIWSQFFFLDGGALLGKDFNTFSSQFKADLRGVQDMSGLESNLKTLRDKISSVSIRRTKEVLELPEKIYEDILVELAPKQKDIYGKARSEMYYEVSSADGLLIEREIENYLVKLLRLTQIASNPALLDLGYSEQPGKFAVLDDIVRDAIESKEKLIVWTSFTGNVKTLRNRYGEFGARMLFGEIPIAERDLTVRRFMEDDHCNVLIANPAAAKEGLTLTSANNAVYLDRTFKMDDYLQSQDRIHRISQTKKCRIVKLIAARTIDEYTDEILEKKESIAKYTLGDVEQIAKKQNYLTKQDLLRILGG